MILSTVICVIFSSCAMKEQEQNDMKGMQETQEIQQEEKLPDKERNPGDGKGDNMETGRQDDGERSAMRKSQGDGGSRNGRGGREEQESHYSEAAEKFKQYEYTDEETNATIPYNLYLPESYEQDSDVTYPLVIFIADAGANSNEVTDVLKEDGATVWATDAEQQKHECIVLAPQYTLDLMNSIGPLTEDTHEWSTGLTLVSNLIFYIMEEYNVDVSRVYGTGQSQGGMTAIALSDKYPELYRAQLLVACQWDVEEMAVMKDDNLWIIVCEGDSKAYPGMNAAVENWEALGTEVAVSEMWDSTSSEEEFAKLVSEMEAQGCRINYTVLEGGSHTYTWSVAYTIEGIRDWLFAQK